MSADAVPGYDAYRPDTRDEFVTDAGTDAGSTSRDTGYDASGVMCGTSTCAPGLACCADTHTCYNPRCPSCCMPVISLDAMSADAVPGRDAYHPDTSS
jgi:hypothetical protein